MEAELLEVSRLINRVELDYRTFQLELDQLGKDRPLNQDEDSLRTWLFKSQNILVASSQLMTTLSGVKFALAKLFSDSGQFALNSTKRFYTAELVDMISSIRSVQYSQIEQTKSARELLMAVLAKNKRTESHAQEFRTS